MQQYNIMSKNKQLKKIKCFEKKKKFIFKEKGVQNYNIRFSSKIVETNRK